MTQHKFFLLAASVLLTIGLIGCEEAVNPVLDSDRNFTLFGTLDLARDTQFVRVIPIRPLLDPGEPGPLDIAFTSTEIETGKVDVWRDSLITFADGSFAHVFYAPLRLRDGFTYRIEIETPGTDVVTSVETTVPKAPRPVVLPEELTGAPGAGIGRGSQRIRWEGLTRDPFAVDLWYRFLTSNSGAFRDVQLPYEPTNTLDVDAWLVTLDLRRDRLTLDTLVTVPTTPLMGLGLQLTVLDEDFVPPGGVFDPEVLVQPGTFSNVENGFGFVGSVGRFSVEWLLEVESQRILAYRTLEESF